MPVNRYYSSAAAATTLSSGIASGDTSITVGSVTGFPVQYPFTLIIDEGTASEEIVTVTAGSGSILTVTRGSDSTTALSHSAGAAVVHGVSARDFREPQEHIAASSGVHGIAGDVVGTSGAQALTNKDLSSTTNTFGEIPQASVAGLTAVWAAYTPGLQNFAQTAESLGSGGTVTGAYQEVGKVVHWWAQFTFGTAPTNGWGGNLYATLPSTPRAFGTGYGSGFYQPSGGAVSATPLAYASALARVVVLGKGGDQLAAPSINGDTPSSGDVLYLAGTYERN